MGENKKAAYGRTYDNVPIIHTSTHNDVIVSDACIYMHSCTLPQSMLQFHFFAGHALQFANLSNIEVVVRLEFQSSMKICLEVWHSWPCKSMVLPGWQQLRRNQTSPQIPQWLSKPLSIALQCFLCPKMMHLLVNTERSIDTN